MYIKVEEVKVSKKKNRSRIEVRNPYGGKIIGSVQRSTKADILNIVGRARKAFMANRYISPYERHKILKMACTLLLDDKDSIATSITKETGKPIEESFGEIERAAFVLEQSAEEALRIYGEVLPCNVTSSEIEKSAITYRRPLGVIAAIMPFNYPLNIAAHKVAPAIAAGNAVVLKPSPLSPLTSTRLLKILSEAGLPKDMFLIVQGFKEEAETLVSSDVNMVTFTGSTEGGVNVTRVAGMKRLSLELGGNSALLVFDDADIKAAVKTAIDQRFRTAGQRCTAVKRLFLHEKIYKEFVSTLIKDTRRLKVGDPMDEKCDIGPLVTEEAAMIVEERIKEAVKEGAKILFGGKRENNFISPTILEDLPEGCELVTKETFGPLLPIFRFKHVNEVIKKVNSTQYGLQAGVYTNRIDVIKKLGKELEVVTLIVNDGPGFRIESIPFGGMKSSGMGREGVRYAINEMTKIVSVVM